MKHLAKWLSLLWLGSAGVIQADDSQYRSEYFVKWLDTKRVDLTTWGQVSLSDSAPNPNQFMAGQKASFDVWQYLALGLNYTYFQRQLERPQDGGVIAVGQHRAEFEINPHFGLGRGVQLNFRNRLELRWIDHVPSVTPVSRHRIEVVVPLPDAWPAKNVFSQYELFYNYRVGWNSEKRLTPLGVTFELSQHVALKAFYLWQAVQLPHDWSYSHVLYTQLYMSF